MDMNNPLDVMGLTPEELDAAEVARKTHKRNGGVCVCGHAAGNHSEYAPPGHGRHELALKDGRSECIPSRVACACAKYEQVLVAEDLRQFRFSTKGPAEHHALAQGVNASRKKQKKVTFESGVVCVACKQPPTVVGAIKPIAYAPDTMHESHTSTAMNVLICATCRDRVRSNAK